MPSSFSPFNTTSGSVSQNIAFPNFPSYSVSSLNPSSNSQPQISAAPPLGHPIYPLPSQLLRRRPAPFANTNPPSAIEGFVDEMGDKSNLFPLDRKRKLRPPEEFRSSKVFITEAKLAASLSDLQLSGRDGNASESSSISSFVQENHLPPDTETWKSFRDSEFMEVDESPTGRRVFPQLEMSESLKEAIRKVEREEAEILPPEILNNIAPAPTSSLCMAIIPYVPPEEQPAFLPDILSRRPSLKRSEYSRTEASTSPKRQHMLRPPSNEDVQMMGQEIN
ncbi:hypothetical protein RvY_14299 [Ramazzottius varieornatus]|uniref:Uncharacterized protein n=1 Tax=Ramazzottius varieornatus TaxID=947166 RepID=A0A1D1VZA3_RAMVA|nr:hypothetical protein RvY_14299 [Ramazzottius varieornatus]